MMRKPNGNALRLTLVAAIAATGCSSNDGEKSPSVDTTAPTVLTTIAPTTTIPVTSTTVDSTTTSTTIPPMVDVPGFDNDTPYTTIVNPQSLSRELSASNPAVAPAAAPAPAPAKVNPQTASAPAATIQPNNYHDVVGVSKVSSDFVDGNGDTVWRCESLTDLDSDLEVIAPVNSADATVSDICVATYADQLGLASDF